MRKIAVLNQKGGVGKTSTTVNLAASLAACGRRTCVLDLDPQAHASLHLGLTPCPGEPSIYDVLTNGRKLSEVRRQVGDHLFLVGADIDLAAAEVELAGVVGRELILRDQFELDEDPFDYLLMDCPPSLGVLTINALCAADEVYIPLQPHFLPLHGLGKLLETIQLVAKRLNPKLKLGGVLLCMYEAGTKLAAEISQDVIDFLAQARLKTDSPWSQAKVFRTRIRRNIRIAEAPSYGQSILEYAPNSPGAVDYLALAQEILDDLEPHAATLTDAQKAELHAHRLRSAAAESADEAAAAAEEAAEETLTHAAGLEFAPEVEACHDVANFAEGELAHAEFVDDARSATEFVDDGAPAEAEFDDGDPHELPAAEPADPPAAVSLPLHRLDLAAAVPVPAPHGREHEAARQGMTFKRLFGKRN